MGVFQVQAAAVQRPCSGHVRAFEEQKEAQPDWGVERAELIFPFLPTDIMKSNCCAFLNKADSGGTFGFSVHKCSYIFSLEKIVTG